MKSSSSNVPKAWLWEYVKNFQFEILTINVISGIIYFREIVLESWRNVNETTPGVSMNMNWFA